MNRIEALVGQYDTGRLIDLGQKVKENGGWL